MKINMEQNKIYTNLLSKTTLKRNVTIILRPFLFSLKMPSTEDEAIKFFFFTVSPCILSHSIFYCSKNCTLYMLLKH